MNYKVGDTVLVKVEVVHIDSELNVVTVKNSVHGQSGYGLEEVYSKVDHDFKPGEVVEVRDRNSCEWNERVFVARCDNIGFPWVVSDPYTVERFAQIRKIQAQSLHENIVDVGGKKYKWTLEEVEG